MPIHIRIQIKRTNSADPIPMPAFAPVKSPDLFLLGDVLTAAGTGAPGLEVVLISKVLGVAHKPVLDFSEAECGGCSVDDTEVVIEDVLDVKIGLDDTAAVVVDGDDKPTAAE